MSQYCQGEQMTMHNTFLKHSITCCRLVCQSRHMALCSQAEVRPHCLCSSAQVSMHQYHHSRNIHVKSAQMFTLQHHDGRDIKNRSNSTVTRHMKTYRNQTLDNQLAEVLGAPCRHGVYLCGSPLQAPVSRGTISTPPPTPTKLPKTPASSPTGTDSL